MPRGSAGDITRGMFDYTTEVKQNDTTTPVADDGVLVSLTATGKATPATDASKVYGIAVRDYRQVGPDGKAWPKDAFVCILRRGYVAVRAAGTPAPEELSTWTPQTKALQPLRRETPRLFLTACLWAQRMTRAWPKSHSTSNRSKKW